MNGQFIHDMSRVQKSVMKFNYLEDVKKYENVFFSTLAKQFNRIKPKFNTNLNVDYHSQCFFQFDCGNLHEAKEPKCTEHNAEFQIFTYKGNSVLLELGLETMFDVNSIMSNMLQ